MDKELQQLKQKVEELEYKISQNTLVIEWLEQEVLSLKSGEIEFIPDFELKKN